MTSCNRSCFKAWFSKYRKIAGAVGARTLFFAHAVSSIFIATSSSDYEYSYFLFSPVLLLIIEGFVTIHWRKNKEWKWFTPSIGMYQLCVVPSLWVMEYRAHMQRNSQIDVGDNFIPTSECYLSNLVDTITASNFTSLPSEVKQYCSCGYCVTIMEQTFLLLMILGRWLLPTRLSSNQKAQLLLVNIAIASDLLDLYEMMKEKAVQQEFLLVTLIMAMWTIGLIQFALISTATTKRAIPGCECFETEIWTLVALLLLDDAPFLALRLVCVIKFKVLSHSSVFFTAKNALLFMMDINRLIALTFSIRKEKRQRQESMRQRETVEAELSETKGNSERPLLELQRVDEELPHMTSYIRR